MLSSLSLSPSPAFLLLLFPSGQPAPLHHPSPTPQIKRFLEDSDNPELNKFVKDFPGSESYHQPEAKTWVSRPQILEPRPQASDLCQDDLEFRPPSWPQPSDSQQFFSASAPLSPSARPRSPWGKLDPYDSSEVEPPHSAPPCLCLSPGWCRKTQGGSRESSSVCLHVCVCMCPHMCMLSWSLSLCGWHPPSPLLLAPRCTGNWWYQQGQEPSWWPQRGPRRSLALCL